MGNSLFNLLCEYSLNGLGGVFFQDVLSLTEFELMEVLDVGLAEVTSAVAQVSEITCPPHQTVRVSDWY